VDETTAMKVSGHKTRSMLLRYNIVTERETADALVRADAYLASQPTQAESEKGQLRDLRADGGGKSLAPQAGIGSSGRIRITVYSRRKASIGWSCAACQAG
jgi:hypothetical protein